MSGLFCGSKPATPKPVRMPVQNTVSYQAAQRRAREAAGGRFGRQSTILSRRLNRSAGKLGR